MNSNLFYRENLQIKYLFLDIDGVLNHEDWYVRKLDSAVELEFWKDCFDPACVKRVNEILEATGAILVVSSSWRFDPNLSEIFAKVGLPTKFLVTPNLNSSNERHYIRGLELTHFLAHQPSCSSYAILDDDTDFTADQLQNHFIRCYASQVEIPESETVRETGLTEQKKLETIKILNDLE